jgi:hypothetical protein
MISEKIPFFSKSTNGVWRSIPNAAQKLVSLTESRRLDPKTDRKEMHKETHPLCVGNKNVKHVLLTWPEIEKSIFNLSIRSGYVQTRKEDIENIKSHVCIHKA